MPLREIDNAADSQADHGEARGSVFDVFVHGLSDIEGEKSFRVRGNWPESVASDNGEHMVSLVTRALFRTLIYMLVAGQVLMSAPVVAAMVRGKRFHRGNALRGFDATGGWLAPLPLLP
jgi:hypothetical protein